MAKDGNIEITLDDACKLALAAIEELDDRNGDPSKHANWIRERRLAWIVYGLVGRIRRANEVLEFRA